MAMCVEGAKEKPAAAADSAKPLGKSPGLTATTKTKRYGIQFQFFRKAGGQEIQLQASFL